MNHAYANSYSPPQLRGSSSPFVVKGRSHSEDPFNTVSASSRAFNTPVSTTPKSARVMTENWRSGSGSDHSSGGSSPSNSNSQRPTGRVLFDGDLAQQHRNDDLPQQQRSIPVVHGSNSGYSVLSSLPGGTGMQLAQDGQAVYPPSCCVFVAK